MPNEVHTASAPFPVAAIQAAPVLLDRDASVEKACALIRRAGADGARLAVLPEGFIPGYPLWVWLVPPGDTGTLRDLYTELLANAVTIPSAVTDRLAAAARDARVNVAIGVNEVNTEASGATLYNTLLFLDERGKLLGRHRKLVPTSGERLVHGQGDGSSLVVHELPIGRLGGLICWENYMPLARYALYAQGAQIHAAPTWDRGEPWLSTLRHVAKEGRVYVVGCCSAVRRDDVPDRLAFKRKYLGDGPEWINPGESAIVNPDGKVIAGPIAKREEILYAEIDPKMMLGPRFQLDVAGHYARPDVFDLAVRRQARPMMRIVEEDEGALPDDETDGPRTTAD